MNDVKQLISILQKSFENFVYDGFAKTMEFKHKKLYDGSYYKIIRLVEALADDGEIDIVIKTGDADFHYMIELQGIGTHTVEVYRSPTFTDYDYGTAMPIYILNDVMRLTPKLIAYHTPTITDNGVRVDFNAAVAPNTNQSKSVSSLRVGEEFILSKNTYYLIKLKNISGSESSASCLIIEGYEFEE
jgi:hypothetical protein